MAVSTFPAYRMRRRAKKEIKRRSSVIWSNMPEIWSQSFSGLQLVSTKQVYSIAVALLQRQCTVRYLTYDTSGCNRRTIWFLQMPLVQLLNRAYGSMLQSIQQMAGSTTHVSHVVSFKPGKLSATCTLTGTVRSRQWTWTDCSQYFQRLNIVWYVGFFLLSSCPFLSLPASTNVKQSLEHSSCGITVVLEYIYTRFLCACCNLSLSLPCWRLV